MKPPTLALCMVLRDQGKFLPHCLTSIGGAVDALYLVTTKSNPAQRQCAHQFGASLRLIKWTDDFSAARTASIRDVPEDWILFLNPDEWFPEPPKEALRRALRGCRHAALALQYEAIEGYTPVWSRRLFKNHSGIRFEGLIHEHIRSSLAELPNATTGHIPVRLVNGADDQQSNLGKLCRSLPLLRREWDRAVQAKDYLQQLQVGKALGLTLILSGDAAAGELHLIQTVGLLASHSCKVGEEQVSLELEALAALCWRYLKTNRARVAVVLCRELEARMGRRAAFRLLRGVALLSAGEVPAALKDLRWLETRADKLQLEIAVPRSHLGVDLQYWLGQCYQQLGNFPKARQKYLACAKANPDHLEYRARVRLVEVLAKNFESTARS
ncbi:MAG: tetratricopeptide repeat protein [Verrucomicrobiota bacterium]